MTPEEKAVIDSDEGLASMNQPDAEVFDLEQERSKRRKKVYHEIWGQCEAVTAQGTRCRRVASFANNVDQAAVAQANSITGSVGRLEFPQVCYS